MSVRLLEPACFEETIRRSRFVAHAAPVSNEAATLAFHEAVADSTATHNCWAWRIGGRCRFNDDGEPGGTAGRPILAVLEGRELDDVMVIVTRYYGGIKLGAGGLIRAYGGTAAKCLDRARTARHVPRLRCELTVDFADSAAVHQLLERHGAHKCDEDFRASGVLMQLDVPQHAVEPLRRDLEDATRGKARLWISR